MKDWALPHNDDHGLPCSHILTMLPVGSMRSAPQHLMRSQIFLYGCVVSIALLVTGCPNGDFTLEGWSGHSKDELIQAWGAPDQELPVKDGGGHVVYNYNWADGYGSYTCRRVFVVDAHGTIQSWTSYHC